MKKPIVLCILDGCGLRESSDGNAFLNANKPTFDRLWRDYPHCILEASGREVGLPKGQMGNSEVGHMNMGAGRIVYQPLELIGKAIEDGSFFTNDPLLKVIKNVKERGTKLHILGLLSDGGVHSHIDHLFAIIDMLKENGLKDVYYHLLLDGRDTDAKSALYYIERLERKIEEVGVGCIASIGGRYYGMDRDNNRDRLDKGYRAIAFGEGDRYDSARELIEKSYEKGITDEFVIPGIISKTSIEDGDGIIAFNFRRDRLREIMTAFTNPKESIIDAKEFDDLEVVTMMPVTNTVLCDHAFDNPNLENAMGEYLAKNGLKQLRIAETEKYAHVTYFYDGGVERKFEGMKKILIPSPKVATYDLAPLMSAGEVTSTLLEELKNGKYDVVILNYANGDMVGHTGVYDAAVKAVEFLDKCLYEIYEAVEKLGGVLLITADHGNCEVMWDEEHNPVTSHTTNPVFFIATDRSIELMDGKLADIAPTMLDLLDLAKPKEMTGTSLLKKVN